MVFDRADSVWFAHYRTPRNRRRTIHIPASLLLNSRTHPLFFPVWLKANFRDLRAIIPRRPLHFRWFTLS